MKLNLLAHLKQDDGELIAGFGNARLIKGLNGNFELRGGTDADRVEANEWCSLFMREAVAACTPLPHHQPRRASTANLSTGQ